MRRLINLLAGNFQHFEIDTFHPLKGGAKLQGLPDKPQCRLVHPQKKLS
jgi:hypothetical protein